MHNSEHAWLWLSFCGFIIFALIIDAHITGHKKPSIRSSLIWTMIWVLCALIFNALLWLYFYVHFDKAVANIKGLEFFTGYLIEKTLSIDNIFAFYMIFHQLRIPLLYQKRVFTYGIWSAIVMRLLLILLGTYLIHQFHWLLYVLGVLLLLTGIKMLFSVHKNEKKDLLDSALFSFLKKHLRVTHEIHNEHFFVRQNKLWYCTPLFIALIFVEISDLIFAFDSIPAIFAITTDTFIVWTSNIFAILGLRSLYFFMYNVLNRYRLLKYGIALILIFVGAKMLLERWIHITAVQSLAFVISIILLFIALSHLSKPGKHHAQ